MKKRQYGFWNNSDSPGFWQLYDNLPQCISEAPYKARIYEFQAVYLGRFIQIPKKISD